jgi:hypothetical protein
MIYDGKQVLRFDTKYKNSDLYNLGNEMTIRKGSGNYESDRTKFNVHYKDMESYNLYQEVKNILNNNNIEYQNKSKTNMLNGITITSGPEFFMTLGMPFKPSGRFYKSGEKKGQEIMIPDIKDKNDIPDEITKFFDDSYNFLKELVGEDNIVIAQVHYDEDTPHLQAYFLPVVDEVKRKVFDKDENGKNIYDKIIGKNGKEKLIPRLSRNKDGTIKYEIIKGKFLNNDQFWKNLGGKESFAEIQNYYNKYINEKGFRLDRGEIGSNKVHTNKLEHKSNELKAELSDLNSNISKSKEELKKVKETLKNSLNKDNLDNITPKKGLTGYNSKDVEKLIDYSINLKNENEITKYQLETQEHKNFSLEHENDFYKNNNKLIEVKKDNFNKYKQIQELTNEKDELISNFTEVAFALSKVLKSKPLNYINDYVKLARKINSATKNINREMDEASDEFSKLFNNDDNHSI